MEENELEEILEEVCSELNTSSIAGVNKECIKEYMEKLLMLNIDFEKIPIEWILENTIGILSSYETIDATLLDVFVDKDLFEDYMYDSFGVFNPVIYELAYQTASEVENKLVTFESRQEYYLKQVLKFKKQLESATNDIERSESQFNIDFYTEFLEKLNNEKNSVKGGVKK